MFDQTYEILLSWMNNDTPLGHSQNHFPCSCLSHDFFVNLKLVAAYTFGFFSFHTVISSLWFSLLHCDLVYVFIVIDSSLFGCD